jgi:tetratricopeptide (TPR) repeat protein
MRAARLALVAIALAVPAHADPAADRFREANDLVRAGDYPKAIALYQEIASSGQESASLYWNWAQAAAARGGQGEALWALLRARELDPGDRAVGRDVQRLREALNLDPAEIAPEPLSAVGRFARRFRLDLVALALLALSVLAHVLVRLGVGRRAAWPGRRWPSACWWPSCRWPVLRPARGWAHVADARRLDVPPVPPRE